MTDMEYTIQGFILRFIVLSHFSIFISFVNKGNKCDRETNDQQDGRQYKMLRTYNRIHYNKPIY